LDLEENDGADFDLAPDSFNKLIVRSEATKQSPGLFALHHIEGDRHGVLCTPRSDTRTKSVRRLDCDLFADFE
jgi:hypothetical protein